MVKSKKKESPFKTYKKILGKDSSFKLKEAYSKIRTKLMFTENEDGGTVYAVVSTDMNEGKTLNSINIATSFAMAGKRTLLIDCDMRNPAVHCYLRLSEVSGLSEILARIEKKINIVHTEQENLFVLKAGVVPPNPSELLGGRLFGELIAQFRKRFDYIILDMPPVGVVADAAIVSSYVDGYVFVVRTMYKDLGEIRKAMEMLQSVQGKIAGFVLNDVEGKNDTDHTYGKYGYDYGSRNNE